MEESKKLTGRDFITIGIFSAIYFVLNLAAMITGIVPVLWLLLPGVAGIVTGQFTVLLLITFAVACVLSEVYRAITKYDSNFVHMTISFILFCYGMLGSPLAIWVYRDSFLAQIQQNSMTAEYVKTLSGLISTPMLIVLCISPIIGGLIGALIAKGLFRKHFKKAGVV